MDKPDRTGRKMGNYDGTPEPCHMFLSFVRGNYGGTPEPCRMFLSFVRDNFVNALSKKTKQCRPTDPSRTDRTEPNRPEN
jgi:hypothetical protein